MTCRLQSVVLLLAANCIRAANGPSLDSLYESNEWFQLRDAVRSDKSAPAFYRGVSELAFHDWTQAEADLLISAATAPRNVSIDTMDQASEAALAMEALSELYFLTGRYKDAADQWNRFVRYAPLLGLTGKVALDASRSLNSYRALYDVLGGYSDQSIVDHGGSRLPYTAVHGSPVIPAAIDGNQTKLLIDTGSGANFMNPSEARRLGLTVHPAAVALDAYDGAKEKTQGVAVANELTIGNFRLRNVAFFVLSEDDDDVPGILGLPALFALGTLKWGGDGMLEIGFPSQPADANLALHEGLLTEGLLGKDRLTLSVDTGTDETLVYPSFAKLLGDIDRDSIAKRGLTLRVAGFDAPLGAAMPVLTTRTGDFQGLDGNLGLDVMEQAYPVTFDLISMRLSVGTPGQPTVEPVTALPETGFPATTPVDSSVHLNEAELREILKQSVTAQGDDSNLDFEPSKDYVYTEDQETRFLDPKGNVIESNTETHENIELYGARYARLIRKDGKPLTPKQERSEQAKLDKEASKRKAASTADVRSKQVTEGQKCAAEFVKWFHFQLLGVESLNGRPAWEIDADPAPGRSPQDGSSDSGSSQDGSKACGEKLVKRFHLRIWIDQADGKWAKVEGDNIALVTWGTILVRVPAGGMHITEELTRRDDGAWLPASQRIHLDAKLILLKTAHLEILSKFGSYRKFQAGSRIVQ